MKKLKLIAVAMDHPERQVCISSSDDKVQCIYWSEFTVDKNAISLPSYIEDNKEVLRRELIEWINNFGLSEVRSKTLIDQLRAKDGFSFWWMSLLHEKSVYKSSWIYDFLKILAMKRIILANYSELEVYSDDKKIIKRISQLCNECGLLCKIICLRRVRKLKIPRLFFIYEKLPSVIRAMIYFFAYFWRFRRFIFFKKINAEPGTNRLLVLSYFPYLDLNKAQYGKYDSHYWCDLFSQYFGKAFGVDWMMQYNFSAKCTASQAVNYVKLFNKSNALDTFNFLHSYLGLTQIAMVVKLYVRFFFRYLTIRFSRGLQRTMSKSICLYELVEADFVNSCIGPVAVSNYFLYVIFQEMCELHRENLGVMYLMENLGWEKCFIHHWKRNSKKAVVGFCHASIRYFDFGYYSILFEIQKQLDATVPDFIAVGGEDAKNKLIQFGISSRYIVMVESLRYIYLNRLTPYVLPKNNALSKCITLACFSDILTASTRYLFNFMANFVELYGEMLLIKLYIKPHPVLANVEILIKQCFRNIPYQIIFDHLSDISVDIDMAILHSGSGAAIDLAYMHLPFVILEDPSYLNLSPLMEHHALFIRSVDDLYRSIQQRQSIHQYLVKNFSLRNRAYYLDSKLPGWNELLKQLL